MTAICDARAPPRDGGEAGDPPPADGGSGRLGPPSWLALGFLLPALLLLGALVAYPIINTAIRSFFDATGKKVVGLDFYFAIFSDFVSLVAVRRAGGGGGGGAAGGGGRGGGGAGV